MSFLCIPIGGATPNAIFFCKLYGSYIIYSKFIKRAHRHTAVACVFRVGFVGCNVPGSLELSQGLLFLVASACNHGNEKKKRNNLLHAKAVN